LKSRKPIGGETIFSLERTRHETRSSSPQPAALLRRAGAVLIEQHDEWEAADWRYYSGSSMRELKTMNDLQTTIE
jgi:hypothetical protein